METRRKIAVVGPQYLIEVFKTAGLKVFFADQVEKAIEKTRDLIEEDNYAVILIYEDLFNQIPDEVYEKLADRPLPAIVALPGLKPKDEKEGFEKLRKIAQRAVGIDILKN